MIGGKHTTKIVAAVMIVAIVLCLTAVAFSQDINEALGGTGVSMEYESRLFDKDEVISINIKMDEADFEEMLANATSEEYYACDVTVNGTTVYNVGIRPKGNTSLSAIVMDPDTDRFSFKLEFDHFVEGQTCFGLDKLKLNNNYAAATKKKEAVIYDMFEYLGADASLYNYASVSLNGEYKGVYLALEGVEKSFILRNYGTQDGELYKPDSMEMGGGKSSSSSSKPSGMNMPDMGSFTPGEMPGTVGDDTDANEAEETGTVEDAAGDNKTEESDKGSGGSASGREKPSDFGGFSMGGNGANLNYTDDELDSYSTIWDGALSDTSKADRKRVIKALKNISEGNDLEEYLDVDNVLKYMAVHAFAVNQDSLSGSMAHNYYLYEYEGKLNILPWDYNLSLGGMTAGGSNSATDMVNDAIDTPFDGTHFFDALLENEEYLAQYHEYLRMLTEEYIDGGRFDEVYSRIREQIDELVKTDPTAFYTYDEYNVAAEMLYDTVKLRAESIEGQLAGTIPSTDEGQRADQSSFVDASHIDTSKMGSFNMGGVTKETEGKRRGGRQRGERGRNTGTQTSQTEETQSEDALTADRQIPSSFLGVGQTQNSALAKNLIVYGICLAVMIILVVVFMIYKRRKI